MHEFHLNNFDIFLMLFVFDMIKFKQIFFNSKFVKESKAFDADAKKLNKLIVFDQHVNCMIL